jgi:hypothetical protein
LFPVLNALATQRAPAGLQGTVVSLHTAAVDLGAVAGTPLCGALAEGSDIPVMFAASALACVVGSWAIGADPVRGPSPRCGRRRVMGEDATSVQRPACPVCDGPVIEVRSKLVCARCRAIVRDLLRRRETVERSVSLAAHETFDWLRSDAVACRVGARRRPTCDTPDEGAF